MTPTRSGTAHVPTPDALKTQAKRLRASLAATAAPITHAMALEMIARQWGYRDWNTLHAAASTAPRLPWNVGQQVTGRYLGHRFSGRLKALRMAQDGYFHVTVVFDQPIDVVTSTAFSSYRKQVNAMLDSKGVTPSTLSDGKAHMVLDLN